VSEDQTSEKARTYVFFRPGFWYLLELPPSTIADNAERNPGTSRVEDALTGEVVWRPEWKKALPNVR
jgi:hypothetical protein